MENDNNSETISNADSPRTPIKNEELLNLLRQVKKTTGSAGK